jgi:hypothetical protein
MMPKVPQIKLLGVEEDPADELVVEGEEEDSTLEDEEVVEPEVDVDEDIRETVEVLVVENVERGSPLDALEEVGGVVEQYTIGATPMLTRS